MNVKYNIGELSDKLGINKETIRYYEKIGLLTEPIRGKNGYRTYTSKDIEIINFIMMAKNFGFTLKEIKDLIHDEILCGDMEHIKIIVEEKIYEIDKKTSELAKKKKLLEKVQEAIHKDCACHCEIIKNKIK